MSIRSLQLCIFHKQFNKYRSNLLKFRLLYFSENKQFEKMTKFITTKIIMDIINNYLHSICRVLKVNRNTLPTAKQLLSAYIIHGYPESVIGKNNLTILENKIMEEANTIIKIIENCNNPLKLYIYFIQYKKIFEGWLKKDMFIQLEIISDMYYQAIDMRDLLKTKNNKNFDLRAINSYLKKLRKHIFSISGNKGLKFLKDYKACIAQRKKLLSKTVIAIAHKAFWDKIALSLKKDIPDWSIVLTLLEELRDIFIEIAPKHKLNIKEQLDIDFIKLKIKNKVFDQKQIFDLIITIIDMIKEYGPPSQDESIQKWKDNILIYFKDSPEFKIHICIPSILSEIFKRVSNIQKATNLIKDIIKLRNK